MERISIFNYEAFYLDYLEGNLSEEDTQMLLQFLEEHPECVMEDEDLFILDDEAPMTYSGKNNLKQVDESGPIGLDNVEHFMIADAEGLLDDSKTAELDAVVAENKELEQTRKRYNAVYYTADESVVFGGKSDLKQRKTLVLWPYMSGAVAAAAVVAIMLMPSNPFGSFLNAEVPGVAVAGVGPAQGQTDPVENPDPIVIPAGDDFQKATTQIANAVITNTTPSVEDQTKMNERRMKSVGHRAFDKTLVPVTKDAYNLDLHAPTPTEDIATNNTKPSTPVLAMNEMENPIEPVTKFINERAQTEVDFKRRKASKERKGGFFLKIGKFEFSKNKH